MTLPPDKCIIVGFGDLLYIGNQARPKIFDLSIEMPEMLYSDVVEVEERLVLAREDCQLNSGKPVVQATTGDKVNMDTLITLNTVRK